MNGKQILSVVGMTLMLAAGNAVADEDGALDDVTIRLMELRDEAPDAVTKNIELPADADVDSEAVPGLDTANTARERRADGLQTALDSIADAQYAASEAAENSGRADDILEDVPAPVDPGRP